MGTSSKPKSRNLPDQAVLRELLDYDAETGVLIWRSRGRHWFCSDRVWKKFSTQYAGKPALSGVTEKGHLRGTLFGQHVLCHRAIWKWMTGEDPLEIDHINGDPKDNRWANLRSVISAENAKNQKRRKDNTSGVCGVYWREDSRKWRAMIGHNGRLIRVGTFERKEDAIAARLAAQQKLDYHPNHGRVING